MFEFLFLSSVTEEVIFYTRITKSKIMRQSPNITISTSLRFAKPVQEMIKKIQKKEFNLYYPHVGFRDVPPTDYDTKKELVLEFFPKIDNCDYLYVFDQDGYIGLSVAAEIGYAFAKKKTIIAKEIPKDLGMRALISKIMEVDEFIASIRCE
jgi:hypothetical protein